MSNGKVIRLTVKEAEKLLEDKDQRIKELEAQLQEAQNKIMWLEKDLADTKTRCEELTAQLQTAKSEAIDYMADKIAPTGDSQYFWKDWNEAKAAYIGTEK